MGPRQGGVRHLQPDPRRHRQSDALLQGCRGPRAVPRRQRPQRDVRRRPSGDAFVSVFGGRVLPGVHRPARGWVPGAAQNARAQG